MKNDYLIVGQGLAGTLLSKALIEKGKNVIIIDEDHLESSTKIAAGMYNPVTFKRLTKTWEADLFLPKARSTYQEFERQLNEKYWIEEGLSKLFTSEDDLELWEKKLETGNFSDYLNLTEKHHLDGTGIKAPFGFGNVKNAGFVKIAQLLDDYRVLLKNQNRLISERIDHSTYVENESGTVSINGIEADRIIFCEGSRVIHNPFFNQLPFGRTKGEVLTIRCKSLQLNRLVNRGLFVLPLGDDLYKIGATFNWKDQSLSCTEEGKQELLEKLKKITSEKVEVVGQIAGLRPTVKDRRPIIGSHPIHKKLAVFNGLGTRGVLIAPYLASQFVDYLIEGKELHKEASISRFSNCFEA